MKGGVWVVVVVLGWGTGATWFELSTGAKEGKAWPFLPASQMWTRGDTGGVRLGGSQQSEWSQALDYICIYAQRYVSHVSHFGVVCNKGNTETMYISSSPHTCNTVQ